MIDPVSGVVEKWIDCRGLWHDGYREANNVLNGIAYDKGLLPMEKESVVV